MRQITETLKQTLLDQHVSTEQIQNILSLIDLNQINLLDLSTSREYLSQFLSSFNLQETIVDNIILELFKNVGISNILGLEQNSDDILGKIGNMIGKIFGVE